MFVVEMIQALVTRVMSAGFQPVRAGDIGGTLLDLLQSWIDATRETLREHLGPPLKALHVPIDEWLGQLPMSVAIASAVGLYVIALLWVWLLRRDFIFRGAPDRRWWRDLRIWATVVVLPYIAVYLLLGR